MNKKLHPISLAVMTLVAGIALTAQAQEVRRSYIVQLPAASASSYEGGIAGLPATKPAPGTHLDITATNVQNYIAYLEKKQNDVLATINPANVTFRYDVALNGFAAMLTDAEVRALKKNTGVLSIHADEIHQLHTATTPAFLGLEQSNSLWNRVGGKSNAGEGMIIAMLDSGVWPEDLSFADRVDANGVPTHDSSGTQVYGPVPAKWKGIGCEIKPGIKASDCNNKLIGIRSYIGSTGAVTIDPNDFLSGRDGTAAVSGGHGSHTLSTAGGNAGVPVTVNGISIGMLSGMAPRARLAMYKVCYKQNPTTGGCASAYTVAAVNQAIKDGVDVINYSIGPTVGGGTITEPAQVAFLNATNAGIFVAASAGNAGPVTGPTANLGPWIATVASATHNRTVGANVIDGSGASYRGASNNLAALPSAGIIDARYAGSVAYEALTDQDKMARRFCYTEVERNTPGATNFPGFPAGTTASANAAMDPAMVAGKIVICDRGNNPRVSKSAAVLSATGVGMVLADNGAGLVTEPHSVPTVHITAADGALLKAYVAASAAPTAELTKAQAFTDRAAPFISDFSSRGPNVADNNMLKPDIAAPGSDVAAAYAPAMTAAEVTTLKNGGATTKTAASVISGTSMASPHIAGLAAVLKQMNPTWTPAMIKSALMTSTIDTLNDGVSAALPWTVGATAVGTSPFAQGAGHVAPNGAADPGLVYDAGSLDYARLSCGFTAPNVQLYSAATCNAIGSIKGAALNLPSITSSAILGTQTISRTVTNVFSSTSTYQATASVDGYDAVVTPANFTIAPGTSQTYSVKLTRTTKPLNTWGFGNVTLTDEHGHNVRIPVSARGTALAAPALVYSEATSGSKMLTIGTGFAGPMSVDKAGLKTATRNAFTFSATSTAAQTALCTAGTSPAVRLTSFVVPQGSPVARFALYDADTSAAAIPGALDDFDMVVLNSANVAVGSSGSDGSNEMVTLMDPVPGTYRVCVIAYSKQARPTATAVLSSWVLAPTDVGGNFKVLVPATAYVGGTASVGMSWSGLATGQRFLGAAKFKVNGMASGTTLVDIQTNDPVPLATSSKPIVIGDD
ncbi:MAG: S8 family serine peptidase [Pseudomonadota bacterium]